MFEPRTFPTAMEEAPSSAALSETRSSGVEVPKPTMVRPMTMGLIR